MGGPGLNRDWTLPEGRGLKGERAYGGGHVART